MIFKNFLVGTLFTTSALTIIPSLSAGFDQYGCLYVSAKKLEDGYKNGTVILTDGTKISIINRHENWEPEFSMIADKKQKFVGFKISENNYSFEYSGAGDYKFKLNHFTLEMEPDFNEPPAPGPLVFDLWVNILSRDSSDTKFKRKIEKEIIFTTSKGELSYIEENTVKREAKEIEEAKKLLPSSRIVQESDKIQNTAKKNFYVEKDENRELWFGIEYISPESLNFWKKRLGYDARLQFEKQVAGGLKFYENLPTEGQHAHMKSFQQWNTNMYGHDNPISVSILPEYLHESEEFSQLSFGSGHIDETEFYHLLHKHGPEFLPAGDLSYNNKNYLSAWRGFRYNLETTYEAPTWMSYVSSKPVTGPLYETFSATDPALKMAMTVKVSEKFYSPLGIYKSPIAIAFEKEHQEKSQTYSMDMHSFVARVMKNIRPDVKFAVVRPLVSMAKILKISGVKYTESKGFTMNTNLPYIRCTTDRVTTGTIKAYFFADTTITTEEKELFGSSPYILVDPSNEEYRQITGEHWFSKNPFLGGVSREKIEAFPFITINLKDLENFKKLPFQE